MRIVVVLEWRCDGCGRPLVKRAETPVGDAVRHHGNDRCVYCYNRERRPPKGPRSYRPSTTVQEWEFLSEQGLSMGEIAAQLGIRPDSLQQAIRRHERRVGAVVA